MTRMAPHFLEIDNVSKRFGQIDALKNVTIDVEEGGFLVLVGPSGCGKSTLLNLIAGFESITSGGIRLGGKSLVELHPSKRDIAMVFQSYALYPNMNVADNIGFGMETRGIPKAERKIKIAEVATILQIEPLLKRKPAQLSGGQRQRVAMGRALVRDPQAFLFDEPLSNLDARLRVDMRAEIKKLHARLGTTIVYVTHDQIEAMTLATRIAVLKQGEVQQIGTPNEIYNEPANTFVADFMGSPAMNRVPGKLSLVDNKAVFSFNEHALTIPHASDVIMQLSQSNTEVEFGIRAENISHSPSSSNGASQNNVLELSIDLIEPTGSDTYITTKDGSASFVARVENHLNPLPNEKLPLAFDMHKVHLFNPTTGIRLA